MLYIYIYKSTYIYLYIWPTPNTFRVIQRILTGLIAVAIQPRSHNHSGAASSRQENTHQIGDDVNHVRNSEFAVMIIIITIRQQRSFLKYESERGRLKFKIR